MRGRKPLPTATKLLSGTLRKDRLNTREPRPTPGLPVCPSFLDAMAQAEWDRLAPELGRLGLLTLIDGASLAAYCVLLSRWATAEAVLARDGLTFVTPNGFSAKRPEVNIARECMALLRHFATEFGLSPASRSRVKAGEPATKAATPGTWPALEDYLSGKTDQLEV